MIANTQCCGYREIALIHEYAGYVTSVDKLNYAPFASLALLDEIFCHVVRSECQPVCGGFYLTSAGPKLGGDAIRNLKEVVAEHSLGFFFETPPIRNPNTGRIVQQFLWVVDWEGLFRLGFDFANRFPEYARSTTRAELAEVGLARELSPTCGVFHGGWATVTFESYPHFKKPSRSQFEWYKDFAKERNKKNHLTKEKGVV